MSESPAPDPSKVAIAIALAVMGAQILAVLQPHAIPFDQEELYNAAHARLVQLGHIDYLLDLQYRGHCGGCTQHALLGACLFTLMGHSLFVWKLIPVLWMGLFAYAGVRFLSTHCGQVASAVFGALLLFPPPAFLELSLTAWGNHFESGVAAIVVLWLIGRVIHRPTASRCLTLGLSMAWALWIGFSSAFIVLALPALLWRRLSRRSWASLVGGLSTVLGIWGLQHYHAMSSPFETIYYAGESIPSISRVPEKLWSLTAPRQLVALFGSEASVWTWAGGIWTGLATLTAGWNVRRTASGRLVLVLVGAFLTIYCTVRFTVWTPPAPEIAPPGSMRYAAPLYGLSFLLMAIGFETAWRHRSRWVAIGIVAPSLLLGVATRAQHLQSPFPDGSVFDMAAPDFEYARDQAAYTISKEDHAQFPDTDPHVTAFHAYALGWYQTRLAVDQDPNAPIKPPGIAHPAALEGLAAALLPEIDPNEDRGLQTLDIMASRLDEFSSDQQVTILTSTARRRPWLNRLPPAHDQARLRALSNQTKHKSAVIQRALSRALGHDWGGARTRWRDPRPLTLPTLEALDHPADFVYGVAHAIGERWGPGPWPIPQTATYYLNAWTDGIKVGSSKRWIIQTR